MSIVFGSCKDLHAVWEVADGVVTFESNVEGQEPVSLCLDPVKGATLNGEPVSVEEGILVLEDMFGTGVVDQEAGTYTLVLPGKDPVTLCINPAKGYTQNADGSTTVTYQNGSEDTAQMTTVADQGNDLSGIVVNWDGTTCEFLKLSAYNPSSAVPSDADGDGVIDTHTIETSDGVLTPVCLDPVKSVTGAGVDNTDPANPVIASSSTTPSDADGDGTVDTHTITTDDGVSTPVCLNPVKNIETNPDGLGATVNYADGTDGQLVYPVSTAVDNGDGSTTTNHPDGTSHTSCDNPVKSVTGPGVDNTDPVNPVIKKTICDLVALPDGPNGESRWQVLYSDDDPATPTGPIVTDTTIPADGYAAFGIADATTVDGQGNPITSGTPVLNVFNADGVIIGSKSCIDMTVVVADSDGNILPIVDGVQTLPASATGSTSSFTSNGDGTTTHDDGNGNPTTNIQEDIVDGGSNLVAADGVTINPLLDCSNAPIDVTSARFLTIEQQQAPAILTTATGLQGVDLQCAPNLPSCIVEGAITVDEKGITWQIIGGAWQPVAFTPACRLTRATLPQITVNDAAMTANGNVVELLGSVCVECTNDDCVPHKVEGRLRGFMLSQLSPGVRVIVSYVFDGANSSEIELTDGTPTYTVDTRREDAGIQNESDGTQIIGFESSDLLLPGETARACFNLNMRVQNYSPAASNILTIQTTIATMKCERCIEL